MTNFKFEAWPTEFRQINQYFGVNPQNYAGFGLPGHEGLDFRAPDGSKIFAVAPGVVASVQPTDAGHPYGIYVRLNHVDNWQTTYGHLRQAMVQPGQQVAAGQLLGLADNTGNSFGSHLHLTLKRLGATYQNWPSNIHDPTPFILPLMGWSPPAGPYIEGWAYTSGLTLGNGLAQANAGGVNLRRSPALSGQKIGLVPGGTIMITTGEISGEYTRVQVARAALGLPDPKPPAPAPPPAPTEATVDGFGFAAYIQVTGGQGVCGPEGINLRAQPVRTAPNIGLVRGGSTVVVRGAQQGEYFPVRVRQADFLGPVSLPPAPVPGPTPGPAPADQVRGWAWTQNLTVNLRQATVGALGINLRAAPDTASAKLCLVKEGSVAAIIGPARSAYTPVSARLSDVLELASPLPAITEPDPFPATTPEQPVPIPDTTPGWVFTAGLVVKGSLAEAGPYGLNLRAAPRRDAKSIGFVPAGASVLITGPAVGEYTPGRIDDRVIQPPLPPEDPAAAATATTPPVSPDPPTLGNCRLGLHASADPDIKEAEFREFAELRPGIIKVLSFHSGEAIARLARDHPDAAFVVRAFLDFGGRTIDPAQFITDTLPDTRRALNALAGRDVVVELHNEPNLIAEGLGASWADGAAFAAWWLDLLQRYRQALPGVRFIYPGLSPGPTVAHVRQDHIAFLESSRPAIEAADGMGIHLYWSAVAPMNFALSTLDDYLTRVRYKPLWVTEASNNKTGTSLEAKAQQYLQFWHELQKRPTVQGVTYFVASASAQTFAEEVWVGRGIGKMVGKR